MTKEQERLSWIIIIVLFALMYCLLTGCAAMEPSSTDNHHRLPQVNCTPMRYDGQMRKVCCDSKSCSIVD